MCTEYCEECVLCVVGLKFTAQCVLRRGRVCNMCSCVKISVQCVYCDLCTVYWVECVLWVVGDFFQFVLCTVYYVEYLLCVN